MTVFAVAAEGKPEKVYNKSKVSHTDPDENAVLFAIWYDETVTEYFYRRLFA